MAELSAFLLSLNEAENVHDLMETLKGVRDVVVLDNGSTDDTVKLFREHGARVYDTSALFKYSPTQEDIDAFRKQFGFDPPFATGDMFEHTGERRNHGASLCRNDWVFNPDCDEFVDWDLKKIKPMLDRKSVV